MELHDEATETTSVFYTAYRMHGVFPVDFIEADLILEFQLIVHLHKQPTDPATDRLLNMVAHLAAKCFPQELVEPKHGAKRQRAPH